MGDTRSEGGITPSSVDSTPETADHRGGNEESAQRARPAPNERCAGKDQREDDERQADLFHAAWHAQLPGWTLVG